MIDELIGYYKSNPVSQTPFMKRKCHIDGDWQDVTT